MEEFLLKKKANKVIQYKEEVTEIVIARFTHFPSPEQVAKAWSDAKRALEVGKGFQKGNLAWRAVERGYEFFVTKVDSKNVFR